MPNASVRACTVLGINAVPVVVEVHLAGGLPGTTIVGLPQSAVRESKDRVKAALQNAGFGYPQVKVVVNLAPADLPKQGGRFDLPIALGILIAAGQLPAAAVAKRVIVGELGLSGAVRPVAGTLPAALALSGSDLTLVLPASNAAEARCASAVRLLPVETLSSACACLTRSVNVTVPDPSARCSLANKRRSRGSGNRCPVQRSTEHQVIAERLANDPTDGPDLCDVVGQMHARRALEIAAAGGHNLLLSGSPGTGKSLLAQCLHGILPPMTEREALEAASVASISPTGFDERCFGLRPFRAPHHTASGVALVGGGMPPLPGEASLAHQGVLFLDEVAEFPRTVLDVLRQPLESGCIVVSRAARQAEFPARFQLIATMNPCPCGYYGDPERVCGCTPDAIARYQGRLSGPLRDRIDMQVALRRRCISECPVDKGAEPSAAVKLRVTEARSRQLERQGTSNAVAELHRLDAPAPWSGESSALLRQAAKKLWLSWRGVHRVRRVARTISDLEGTENVLPHHVIEALSYRQPPERAHRLS